VAYEKQKLKLAEAQRMIGEIFDMDPPRLRFEVENRTPLFGKFQSHLYVFRFAPDRIFGETYSTLCDGQSCQFDLKVVAIPELFSFSRLELWEYLWDADSDNILAGVILSGSAAEAREEINKRLVAFFKTNPLPSAGRINGKCSRGPLRRMK
jgi:hypothetical protein